MRRIAFSDEAARYVEKLRLKDKARVEAAVLELAEAPMAGKRLKGRFERDRTRSYRVWPFRILYTFTADTILVITIGHRQDVYG